MFFLPGLTVAIHQGNDILEHGNSMLFGRFSGWSLGHGEGRKLTTSISFSSWQQRWTNKITMLSSCIIYFWHLFGGLPKKKPVVNVFFFGRKSHSRFQDRSWLSTSQVILWNQPPTVITRINSMGSNPRQHSEDWQKISLDIFLEAISGCAFLF